MSLMHVQQLLLDVVVVVVKIFTFQILIFFCTNSRGCYKNYKYITKTRRKKNSKLHNPDRIKGEMCAVAKGA